MYRILLLILFAFACTSKNQDTKQIIEKIECIDELTKKNKQLDEYKSVIEYLQDTLIYFVGNSPHSHHPEIVNYKLDELILFNENTESCLLFLLEVYVLAP